LHPLLGPLVRPSKDAAGDSTTSGETDSDETTRQSLGWLTYQALEQHEEEEEARRLFYVATTRARDTLILSAGLGPAEKPASPAMALLDERFDRLTGDCRATLPEGWGIPRIAVIRESPPPLPSRGAEVDERPSLVEVAKVIERAAVADDPHPSVARQIASYLDLDPALGLAPGAARLDRLCRAAVADAALWRSDDWTKVAVRGMRKTDPLVSPSRIEEVIKRLRPWVEGPIGKTVARAATIESAVDWTIAWPPASAAATVFHGKIDVVYRDCEGSVGLIVFGDAVTAHARERLRLLLSSRPADELGLGPVHRGWIIRLGAGGESECVEEFHEVAIDAAIDALLAT
jgi:ATP-dependent helicase/nuclease subunit A